MKKSKKRKLNIMTEMMMKSHPFAGRRAICLCVCSRRLSRKTRSLSLSFATRSSDQTSFSKQRRKCSSITQQFILLKIKPLKKQKLWLKVGLVNKFEVKCKNRSQFIKALGLSCFAPPPPLQIVRCSLCVSSSIATHISIRSQARLAGNKQTTRLRIYLATSSSYYVSRVLFTRHKHAARFISNDSSSSNYSRCATSQRPTWLAF